jgi:PTEN phosphatase family protein
MLIRSQTYITPSCIAMSLPATGAEAHFRNPIDEVQRFFYTMHPSHFLIFNLCAERTYDASMFGGCLERIEVEDHNPPRMSQLVSFIQRVASFLEQDPENVIAVHCKGGKGRTGVSSEILCARTRTSRADAALFVCRLWCAHG